MFRVRTKQDVETDADESLNGSHLKRAVASGQRGQDLQIGRTNVCFVTFTRASELFVHWESHTFDRLDGGFPESVMYPAFPFDAKCVSRCL